MNGKEVSELRRRFRPEKSAVSRVYGCYVNGSSREIISYLDESLGLLPQEEAEKYLGLLKKSLSGRLGRKVRISHKGKKGRIELEYYNEQDLEALLQQLRDGGGDLHA